MTKIEYLKDKIKSAEWDINFYQEKLEKAKYDLELATSLLVSEEVAK